MKDREELNLVVRIGDNDDQVVGKTITIGPIEIVLHEVLGKGATGTVYQGTTRETFGNQPLAVKRICFNQAGRGHDFFRNIFRRECALMALSDRNPHILRLFGSTVLKNEQGEEAEGWIALEFAIGRNTVDLLKKYQLRRKQNLPCLTTFRIIKGVLHGLAHLERLGLIHGDIKPENIFIACPAKELEAFLEGDIEAIQTEHVRIGDFGITRTPEELVLSPSSLAGTPDYMAPEQITPSRLKPEAGKSDLPAVGVTLTVLLTGQSVYGDETVFEILNKRLSRSTIKISPICYPMEIQNRSNLMQRVLEFTSKLTKGALLNRYTVKAAVAEIDLLISMIEHPTLIMGSKLLQFTKGLMLEQPPIEEHTQDIAGISIETKQLFSGPSDDKD